MIVNFPYSARTIMSEYREKWRAIGLNNAPANKPRAEEAIKALYRQHDLLSGEFHFPEPTIVWCGSPVSAARQRAKNRKPSVIVDLKKRLINESLAARYDVDQSGLITNEVSQKVSINAMNELWRWIGEPLVSEVWEKVWKPLWIDAAWREAPATRLDDEVISSATGQRDFAWFAIYEFLRNECGLVKETNSLVNIIELCKTTSVIFPTDTVCYAAERYESLQLDDEGYLHGEQQPAMQFSDGYALHYWHGVEVPENWLRTPSLLKKDEALSCKDRALRQAACEIYLQNQRALSATPPEPPR